MNIICKKLCSFYYFFFTSIFSKQFAEPKQKKNLLSKLCDVFLIKKNDRAKLFNQLGNELLVEIKDFDDATLIKNLIKFNNITSNKVVAGLDEEISNLILIKTEVLKEISELNRNYDLSSEIKNSMNLSASLAENNYHLLFCYSFMILNGMIDNNGVANIDKLIDTLSKWPDVSGIMLALYANRNSANSELANKYVSYLYSITINSDADYQDLYQICKKKYSNVVNDKINNEMKLINNYVNKNNLKYDRLLSEVVFSNIISYQLKQKIINKYDIDQLKFQLEKLPFSYDSIDNFESLSNEKLLLSKDEKSKVANLIAKSKTIVIYNPYHYLDLYFAECLNDLIQCNNFVSIDVSKLTKKDYEKYEDNALVRYIQKDASNVVLVKLVSAKDNLSNKVMLEQIDSRNEQLFYFNLVGLYPIDLSNIQFIILCDPALKSEISKYNFSSYSMDVDIDEEAAKKTYINLIIEDLMNNKKMNVQFDENIISNLVKIPNGKFSNTVQSLINNKSIQEYDSTNKYLITLDDLNQVITNDPKKVGFGFAGGEF